MAPLARHHGDRTTPPQASGRAFENETIFEICIIFFALVSYSGRGFTNLFRAPALAVEIRRHGHWHLTILMSMLALTMATRLWFTSKHGWHRFDNRVAIPSLACILALAIVFKLKLGLKSKDSPSALRRHPCPVASEAGRFRCRQRI